jgi:hypothetical protein
MAMLQRCESYVEGETATIADAEAATEAAHIPAGADWRQASGVYYLGDLQGQVRSPAQCDALDAELGAESVQEVGTLLAYTPEEWNIELPAAID